MIMTMTIIADSRPQSTKADAGPRVASVHFITSRVLAAVSELGDLRLYAASAEGLVPLAQSRDSMPPRIGRCVATSIASCADYSAIADREGDDGAARGHSEHKVGAESATESKTPSRPRQPSRLVMLRAIDVATSQLFTMTVLSPMQTLHAKMAEGLFDEALEMAQRFHVHQDVVRKEQWRWLLDHRTQTSSVVLLDVANDKRYGSGGGGESFAADPAKMPRSLAEAHSRWR